MIYDFILLLRNPHLRPGVLRLWAGWTVATAIGWSAAGLTGLPIGRVVLGEGGASAILSVAANMGLIGGLIGALAGTGQWFYLRRKSAGSALWLVGTAAGWAIGLPLALMLNLYFGLGISAGLYGLFVGAGVGSIQALLCRSIIPSFSHWFIANLLAFVLGISAAGAFERMMLTMTGGIWGVQAWQSALSAGLSGVIVGLITGISLAVLRNRTATEGNDQ